MRVIVLTMFELDEYVFEALRAEASGFLVKNIQPDDLRLYRNAVTSSPAMFEPP